MGTMFLKFENEETLTEPVEVLAWSWGFAAGAGVQDISLTKFIGPETARMLGLGHAATKIPRAIFTAETDSQRITITMNEVMVSHVSVGGSGGESRLTENVTLAFAEAEFKTEELLDGRVRGHQSILRK